MREESIDYVESVKKTSKQVWNVNSVIICINIDFFDGIIWFIL